MNSTVLNIFISFAGLLWGDPRDCVDPTNLEDDTCGGGLASVASVIRNRGGGTGSALHIPKLDDQNKFVQMHPSGIGINKLISHDHFGWNAFTANPYFFTKDNPEMQNPNFRGVLSNLDLPRASPWAPYLEGVYFDHNTGATFIHFHEDSPATGGAYFVECLVSSLDYVAKVNKKNGCNDDNDDGNDQMGDIRCWLPPIVFFYSKDDQIFNELLQAGLKHDYSPLLIYGRPGNTYYPKVVENKTAFVTLDDDDEVVSHLRIKVEQRGKNERVISIKNWTQVNVKELPEVFKDDEYIEDQRLMRSFADEAIGNDPVVGTSGFMPLTRTGNWRKCMGGECPIGNLFLDAMRGDADFAVENSGGFRGPGWPAGDVKVSDIWSASPFVNYRCSGVMSGVSVFRLLNHSTALATFESTKTELGDRLMQLSGIKMSYNTLVSGTRLMSVDIWDKEANDYLPLERLKLYKFATSNWMCDHFDQFPSLLGSALQMEGEIPGTVDESITQQEIVAEYLTELKSAYDTTLRGSHVNDTNAFEPMEFIQTQESCLLDHDDHYWQAEKLSCFACPGGKNIQFSDHLISFLATPDSQDFVGRNVLYNRELFNVTIAPKLSPSWVALDSSNDLTRGPTVLQAGESIAIEFDLDLSVLAEGTTRSTVSFGILVAGDYPGCLTDLDIAFDSLVELRMEENLNQIDSIRPVGWALMALAAGLAVFFFAWTYKHRQHRVMLASQPAFMQLICIGNFVMALSIIPLSIDDSIASPEGCSIACMAFPWLFAMGFAITFSALFAKLWRINKVLVAAGRMRRVVVKKRFALIPIAVIIMLNLLLLLIWTIVDPLIWVREFVNQDPANSYGHCESEGKAHVVVLVLLIVLNGFAVVLACERAYRARNIADGSFIESRWVGVACLSWFQVLAMAIPIILLTGDQPVTSYFTRVAIVFLLCISMLLFMFLPKMRLMQQPQDTPRRRTFSQQQQREVAQVTDSVRNSLNCSHEPSQRKLASPSNEIELRNRIIELEKLLESSSASGNSTRVKTAEGETKQTWETASI